MQDYFEIVKNPIDLSTIKRKLDTGQYQEPWQYVEDVWLMFNNAWLYNRKTSRVYKYCTKLAEVFEVEIDPVMQSLGYCCGRKVRDWKLEQHLKKIIIINLLILHICVYWLLMNWHNTFLVIPAVWILTSDIVLLWQTAVHHLQGRHLLQLSEQVKCKFSGLLS